MAELEFGSRTKIPIEYISTMNKIIYNESGYATEIMLRDGLSFSVKGVIHYELPSRNVIPITYLSDSAMELTADSLSNINFNPYSSAAIDSKYSLDSNFNIPVEITSNIFKLIVLRDNSDMDIDVNYSTGSVKIEHGLIGSINTDIGIDYEFSTEYALISNIEIDSDINSRVIQHYTIKQQMDLSSWLSDLGYALGYSIKGDIFSQSSIPLFNTILEELVPYPDYYQFILSLLPERYKEDEDYLVFINSLAREFGKIKEQISKLPDIKDPYHSPEDFLEDIARMLGYDEFRRGLEPTKNRLVLSKYVDILRRKATPRIIRAAVRFEGHPEDLTHQLEDYVDTFINIIDTGIYEVMYENPDLSPSQEDIINWKQAGVKVLFAYAALLYMADYTLNTNLSLIVELYHYVERKLFEVEFFTVSQSNFKMLRQPKIYGSPLYEIFDITELELDDNVIYQPDFEIETYQI
jgi:hypothetical protein